MVLLWLLAGVLGCAPGSDESTAKTPTAAPELTAADIQLPESYNDALPRIAQCRAAMEMAIRAGRPHDAHDPLDEADILLARLMPLARDSGVPRRKWEEINITARRLRERLLEIHAALDEEREPDLAEFPQIDDLLARLRALASNTTAQDSYP